MATKRKTRSDTAQGKIDAKNDLNRVIDPPEGINFTNDDELVLWNQFVSARNPDTWREFDLIILAKMVKLESRIRKHNLIIDETGPIVENKRGTMVENPMLRVVDTLQRQQLAMIRSLSLGVSSKDAISKNASGSKAQDKADTEQLKKDGAVSLLAH